MKIRSYIIVLTLIMTANFGFAQEDIADGFTSFYHPNGQKSSEGFILNGKPVQCVTRWTEDTEGRIACRIGNVHGASFWARSRYVIRLID